MNPASWREKIHQLIQTLESSPFSSTSRLDDDLTTKVDRIENCLSQNPVDLWQLRELALSKGGLISRTFRWNLREVFYASTLRPNHSRLSVFHSDSSIPTASLASFGRTTDCTLFTYIYNHNYDDKFRFKFKFTWKR